MGGVAFEVAADHDASFGPTIALSHAQEPRDDFSVPIDRLPHEMESVGANPHVVSGAAHMEPGP